MSEDQNKSEKFQVPIKELLNESNTPTPNYRPPTPPPKTSKKD